MSVRQEPHPMLDDVALYALGVLPAADASRVRTHIASCEICSHEYQRLAPAANAVGYAAENGGSPSALLKPRIMAKIRAEKGTTDARIGARTARQPVWPAYLVAAACLLLAIGVSVWNVALLGQARQAAQDQARAQQHARSLAQSLTDARTTLSDLLGSDARHYVGRGGEVVARGGRLYVAIHDLPQPPRGHVYQVWTMPKGTKALVPSFTFLPDAHGAAVIALTPDAHATAAVAVSIEPEGGSKHPTTAPVFLVPLS